MNWYKKARKIETFEERNKLNERIRLFKFMTERLKYLKEYVFMNAPHAKKVVMDFANDKRVSSYPEIKKILMQAHDKALDNYKTFSEICDQAMEKFYIEVKKMEAERREFVNKTAPDKVKGMYSGKREEKDNEG